MPWAFRFAKDGGTVGDSTDEPSSFVESPLDHLPWRELQALAKKYQSVAPMWMTWKDYPLAIGAQDLDAFQELRALAAQAVGVTIEPLGDSKADAEKVLLELVEIGDDLPTDWADGVPQAGSQATS